MFIQALLTKKKRVIMYKVDNFTNDILMTLTYVVKVMTLNNIQEFLARSLFIQKSAFKYTIQYNFIELLNVSSCTPTSKNSNLI